MGFQFHLSIVVQTNLEIYFALFGKITKFLLDRFKDFREKSLLGQNQKLYFFLSLAKATAILAANFALL